MPNPFKHAPGWILPLPILAAVAGLYVYLMNPGIIGLIYDDGMYLVAARALADGEGYRLSGMLGEPLFYKYPPLFPLFLAAILPFFPDASAAAPALKLANILLALTSLGLLYVFLIRCCRLSRPLAIGLALMPATNWAFVEASIELMSEPLFFLLSLLLIMQVSRLESGQSGTAEGIKPLKTRQVLILAGLGALAFYARTMGVVLIAATALWLIIRGEKKPALIYCVVAGLLCAPWLLWSMNKPDQTLAIGDFLVRSFQESYFQSLRLDLRYEYNLFELYGKGAETLIGNMSLYFFPLLAKLSALKAAWAETVIMALSFALALSLGFRLFHAIRERRFSFLGIYLTLYLLILPFWSFFPFYPRFMAVILPFLALELIRAVQGLAWPERRKQWLAGGLIAAAILTNLIHLWPYMQKPYRNTPYVNAQTDMWREYQSVFRFIRTRTPEDAVIYTDNHDESYLFALHAGRRVPDFFLFLPRRALPENPGADDIRRAVEAHARVTHEMLKRTGVDYFISHRGRKNQARELIPRILPVTERMLEAYPGDFEPVARSPEGWLTVYRFRPEKP